MSRVVELLHFVLLIFSYFFSKIIAYVTRGKIKPRIVGFKNKPGLMTKMDIIELSFRNLAAKKNRTLITIGGITLGISIIVFLVSLGFGVQELVVNRVARLEEMSQADVTLASGSNLKFTDETLNSFKDITHLKSALPLISVVGHVGYNNSVSDMAVYGVTSDFLNQSAIKPTYGKIFENNTLVSQVISNVSSSQAEVLDELNAVSDDEESSQSSSLNQEVEYTIENDLWLKVRQDASSNSKIIGYTKGVGKNSVGIQLTGEKFSDYDGSISDQWIKTKVSLWEAGTCDQEEADCEDGKYKVMRGDDNSQVEEVGYVAVISGVEISSLSKAVEVSKSNKATEVDLSSEAIRQAVVNKAFLSVLNINENEAVGKKFSVAFVATGDFLDEGESSLASSAAEYEIVGVTPDEKTPVFYVPFIDLRSLGVTNYSQVKIEVDDQSNLEVVRRQIEAMGYTTNSVSDTVNQINRLFTTLRIFLALLGLMALSVAALGMFNTLTVSLMERTHEVGLMKTMGMKSNEVRDLFMAESLIIGISGGVFGLIIGFILGKILSLILSLFSVFKGLGFINISSIPWSFTLIIIVLSLVIGILTGIYPAKRATKISALNALRYE